MAEEQKLEWRNASLIKRMDGPVCIQYDGGGAPCFDTVDSMDELNEKVSKFNRLHEIWYLCDPENHYSLNLE